jgi:hypothetical protein
MELVDATATGKQGLQLRLPQSVVFHILGNRFHVFSAIAGDNDRDIQRS